MMHFILQIILLNDVIVSYLEYPFVTLNRADGFRY